MLDVIPLTDVGGGAGRVKVYTLPEGKKAYLVSLIITNTSGLDAVVTVYSGSAADAGNYGLMKLYVPNNATVVLNREDMDGMVVVHDIYVESTQNVSVSGTVDLR